MKSEHQELSSADLMNVTGGGWKAKALHYGWEGLKWTGIPAAVGGAYAWAEHKIKGK